jgi:hypothetical protein
MFLHFRTSPAYLSSQITLHEIMAKGWITHDVQLYTTTWSNMRGSLKAVHWQL